MARRPYIVYTDRGQANFATLESAAWRARRQARVGDDSHVCHRLLSGFLAVPETGPVVVHGEGTIHEADWIGACERAGLDFTVVGSPTPPAPAYPEHDKLRAVAEVSQAQGEFVEWLATKGVVLAEHGCRHGYVPPTSCALAKRCARGDGDVELVAVRAPVRSLLAEFHGIDQAKLDAEKDAMLADTRTARPATNTEGVRPC